MNDFSVTLPSSVQQSSSVSTRVATEQVTSRQDMAVTGGKELPPQAALNAVKTAAKEQEQAKEADKAEVESAVSHLSDYVQTVSRELQFEIDSDIDDVIVTVLDRETGDVIRQIPQDEVVRMAKYLAEHNGDSAVKGLFINTDTSA